jgi:hypothetical protein
VLLFSMRCGELWWRSNTARVFMAGNCHCNFLRDTCVHEISDSRAPQVVNEKLSIVIPCEAVFISGLDQRARSKSTSCSRVAEETSDC